MYSQLIMGATMGRVKGATNKISADRPDFLDMPEKERIAFIANLIVDQLLEEPTAMLELTKMLNLDEAAV
jgi:hypothetical protein